MTRHKHADVIHAWADGAEIQKFCGDGWYNDSDTPEWFEDCEYRIKPRIVKHEGWVNINRVLTIGAGQDRYIGAQIFCSKQDAEFSRTLGYVTTVKVEWEEEE